MMSLLFVYGSLKEGFPNFHVNQGRRVPGEFATVQPHPLYLLDGRLPFMLPTPGVGLPVRGQLFEVSDAEMAKMDELERVGQPGGYARVALQVQPLQSAGDATTAITAFAYVQDEALLQRPGDHVGPLAEYTLAQARHLRW